MFDLSNWSNPETLWLNITNAGLGLFVLAILGNILYKIVHAATGGPDHHAKH